MSKTKRENRKANYLNRRSEMENGSPSSPFRIRLAGIPHPVKLKVQERAMPHPFLWKRTNQAEWFMILFLFQLSFFQLYSSSDRQYRKDSRQIYDIFFGLFRFLYTSMLNNKSNEKKKKKRIQMKDKNRLDRNS